VDFAKNAAIASHAKSLKTDSTAISARDSSWAVFEARYWALSVAIVMPTLPPEHGSIKLRYVAFRTDPKAITIREVLSKTFVRKNPKSDKATRQAG